MSSFVKPPQTRLVQNLALEGNGSKNSVKSALPISSDKNKIVPTIINISNLASGFGFEARDSEVEIGFRETIRQGAFD